jgi:hypothetical protein
MLGALKALLSLVNLVAAYFTNRQLLDAGKAEQIVKNTVEVEKRVEQAENAVTVPDAERDDRLRNRFDRSRSGGK